MIGVRLCTPVILFKCTSLNLSTLGTSAKFPADTGLFSQSSIFTKYFFQWNICHLCSEVLLECFILPWGGRNVCQACEMVKRSCYHLLLQLWYFYFFRFLLFFLDGDRDRDLERRFLELLLGEPLRERDRERRFLCSFGERLLERDLDFRRLREELLDRDRERRWREDAIDEEGLPESYPFKDWKYQLGSRWIVAR